MTSTAVQDHNVVATMLNYCAVESTNYGVIADRCSFLFREQVIELGVKDSLHYLLYVREKQAVAKSRFERYQAYMFASGSR